MRSLGYLCICTAIFVVAFVSNAPFTFAAPVQAIPSDLAADLVGINTHLNYTDTVYYSHYTDIIKPRLLELGVRHIRDNTSDDTTVKNRYIELARVGIRLLVPNQYGSKQTWVKTMNSAVEGVSVVEAVEYSNETDGWVPPGYATFQEYLKAAMPTLYPQYKGDTQTASIPFLGPSFANVRDRPGQLLTALANASNYMDIGNVHDYPGGQYPEGPAGGGWGISMTESINRARLGSTKAVWATELGYRKSPDDPGHRAVSETAAAKYFPRVFLSHLKRSAPRVYIYQLVDNGQTDELGIINHDGTLRKQFTAIKNFIQTFKDAGAAFPPEKLDYTLTGDLTNVESMLFQKRDKTFLLVLWQAVSSSNGPADINPVRKNVTVTLANAATTVRVYEPTFDLDVKNSLTDVTAINVAVPDHITVIEINGHGIEGTTSGTATTGTGTVTTGTTGGTTGTVVGGLNGSVAGSSNTGTTGSVYKSAYCTERYTNANIPPTGYGAAYNVFSGAKELLLRVGCNTNGDALFSAYTPDTATTKYVLKTGYRWNGGSWVPITFTGTPAPGPAANGWLLMGATTTIANADLRPQGVYTFFAAYTCTFANSKWNCGCRDTYCVFNGWQIQAMRNPVGSGVGTIGVTGGTVTVGGTTGGTTGDSNTVATPTISPPGGTFTTTQTVTLAVATAGATMHYTLDGSAPTETSPTYTAPFTITDTKTVKVGAWKTGLTPSAIATAVFTKGAAAAKPNIILIVTDDQDYASLAKMPKVKSLLVDQGVQFTNYIDNLSLCCPARTTILTGMYAHNHGVMKQSPPPPSLATGFRENKALPVWLKNAGYTNAFYGKYFNFYGGADGYPASHVPPGWDEWNGVPRSGDHLIHSYYNYAINENGTIRNYGSNATDYMTDVLTNKVLNFLETQRSTTAPFYIQLAYLAPHDDLTNTPTTDPIPAPRYATAFASEPLPRSPNFNEADMSDKPTFITSNQPLLTAAQIAEITVKYRKRLAALMAVDDGVESVIQKLQAIGKLGNTYILYISDNGWYAGEHRIAAGKESFFEESIRLPFVVRGPNVVHTTNTKLVSDVDIAPTIVDLADASETITFDGRSLVPILEGGNPAWRTAIRVDGTLDYDPVIPGTPAFDAIRTTRYTYAEHDNHQKELYDLLLDPYELLNKAGTAAYTAVQADLATKLGQLRNCTGLNCWITAPETAP